MNLLNHLRRLLGRRPSGQDLRVGRIRLFRTAHPGGLTVSRRYYDGVPTEPPRR